MAQIKQELVLVDSFTSVFEEFTKKLDETTKKFDDLVNQMTENDKHLNTYTNTMSKFSNNAANMANNSIDRLITRVGRLGLAYLGLNRIMSSVTDGAELLDAGIRHSSLYGQSTDFAPQATARFYAGLGNMYGEKASSMIPVVTELSKFTSSMERMQRYFQLGEKLASIRPGTSVSEATMDLANAMYSRSVSGLTSKYGLSKRDELAKRLNFNLEMGHENYVFGALENMAAKRGANAETVENMRNSPVHQMRQFSSTIQNTVSIAFSDFIAQIESGIRKLNDFTKTEKFEAFARTLSNIFTIIGRMVNSTIDIIMSLGPAIGNAFTTAFAFGATLIDYVANNLNRIIPIMQKVLTAYIAYRGVLLGIRIIEAARIAIMGTVAGVTALVTMAQGAYTIATGAATAAQLGLNAAFYAFPGTWIAAALVGVAAILATVTFHINKASNGMSTIYNVIKTGAQFAIGIFNYLVSVANFVIDIVNNLVMAFGTFANFLGNIFTAPVAAIILLFKGLFDMISYQIKNILSAVDWVGEKVGNAPGLGWMKEMNLSGKWEGVQKAVDDKMSEWAKKWGGKEYVDTDKSAINRFEYMDMSNADKVAKAVEDFLKDMQKLKDNNNKQQQMVDQLSGIKDNTGETNAHLENLNWSLDPDAWKDQFAKFFTDQMERKDVLRINNEVKTPTITINVSNNGMGGNPYDMESLSQSLKSVLMTELGSVGMSFKGS